MAKQAKTDQQLAEEVEVRIGWKMAGIGMTVTSEVIAGVLLGWLFDFWRGHGRIGVTIGATAGILVAIWSLLQGTLKLNRTLDRKAPTKGRGTPLEPPAEDRNSDDWQDPTDDDDWNNNRDG